MRRRRGFPGWNFGHLRDHLFPTTTQIFPKVFMQLTESQVVC